MDSPQVTGLDSATFLRGSSRRNKLVQDIVMADEDPAPGSNAAGIQAPAPTAGAEVDEARLERDDALMDDDSHRKPGTNITRNGSGPEGVSATTSQSGGHYGNLPLRVGWEIMQHERDACEKVAKAIDTLVPLHKTAMEELWKAEMLYRTWKERW